MKRITVPLTRMGARIEARHGEFPPLVIQGTALDGIDYSPPVASAQVKSCVLLAGLTARGNTRLSESVQTRDHTERALPVFGASLEKTGLAVSVSGPVRLKPARVTVPRDFSAAAFFILAAILVPGSEVRIPGVGVNPTRTGVLDLLEQSGAKVERRDPRMSSGEPICDLVVRSQPEILSTFPSVIGGEWIPNVIDEIPVLAVLGTRLKHGLKVKDAAELRKKESDRIRSTVENLRQLGVRVEEQPDGFSIPPGQRIQGGLARTYGDHRVAMAFAVAGLVSSNGVELDDPSCVAVSFPNFFEQLQKVRQ
jgi:3-phosphoshikimate 1-carboxyvinyltransferase